MTEITHLRQLLLHELGDILYAERVLEQMLPRMAERLQDDAFKQRVKRHIDETGQQIRTLEQVFHQLGEEPATERCDSIEGMRSEYEHGAAQVSQELLDVLALGAAGRQEHYEIAAYTSLIQQARALGQDEAAGLLQQNLDQAKSMLGDLEREGSRIARERAQGVT
jgi:ferritin-like metal-binding protein YciE